MIPDWVLPALFSAALAAGGFWARSALRKVDDAVRLLAAISARLDGHGERLERIEGFIDRVAERRIRT